MSKLILSLLFIAGLNSYAQAAQPKTSSGDSGLITSGYLDTQMQWGHGTLDLNGQATTKMPGDATGFSLYQGAVMLSDEFEKAELVIDIPFRQDSTPEVLNNGALTVASNDLELGTKEAQAYVKYQYDMGLFWQIGQFDSAFGLEGNDSTDMVFSQFGILQPFTPNTHTGLLVGYSFLPFYVNVIVGNGDSLGVQSNTQGPQIGARLGWSQDPFQFSVGALYTKSEGNYFLQGGETPSYKPNILLNAVFTATIRKIDLGVEFDVAQSRMGKAQTISGSKDHEKVFGAMFQGTYSITEKLSAGVRYEYLKNDETNEYVQFADAATNATAPTTKLTGQGGYISKMSVGVRRVINENLSAKAGAELVNLNIGQDAPAEGKTQTWTQGSVGAVYNF